MGNEKPRIKIANLIIIAVLVIAALGLLIASRALPSQNSGRTSQEIEAQRSALTTVAPTEGPTTIPETTATPEQESAAAAGYVFIIVENRVYGIEPLGEERDVTVDQGDGVVNVIHLLPDGFYMHSSTCDNQLCVTEGTVTLTNWQQRILGPCVYCLPHNLQVELVIPNAQPDPDAPDA